MLDKLVREAVAAIHAAFPDAPPPSPAEMHGDHCPECIATNAVFAGRRWQEITVADLARNLPVSLLTPAAFRYYLPALMLRSVEAPGLLDCVPEGVVGSLSPPNGKPSEDMAAVYATFDEAQIRAIVAFLRVFEAREKLDGYPPEAFEWAPVSRSLARAIDYWSGRMRAGGEAR